jgi:hypothetical protein
VNKGFGLIVGFALAISVSLSGCSAGEPAKSSSSELSTMVDTSIARFDAAGGSETTSDGKNQNALVYDPSTSPGKQVVMVDLANANSPKFGATSAITIRSMRALLDSSAFQAAQVKQVDNTFTAAGKDFTVTVNAREGIITQIRLSAGSGDNAPTQLTLMTYGLTPEAKKLFDSAK